MAIAVRNYEFWTAIKGIFSAACKLALRVFYMFQTLNCPIENVVCYSSIIAHQTGDKSFIQLAYLSLLLLPKSGCVLTWFIHIQLITDIHIVNMRVELDVIGKCHISLALHERQVSVGHRGGSNYNCLSRWGLCRKGGV